MDPQLIELIGAGAPGDEVAVIVRLAERAQPPAALRIVARFGVIATGRAFRGQLAAIHADPGVLSLKAPRTYATEIRLCAAHDEPGISEAATDPLDTDRRRPENLAETGKGAIVAVIDWGCDFAHPDFCTDQGTRLLALWDQRAAGSPSPYGYGRIHSRAAINQALRSAAPFDHLGYSPSLSAPPMHGTHVLGIAAGNGRAGGPPGLAPDANIIFVHLGPGVGDLGNSVDLLEAIHFVTTVAGTRPLSINMSIGRHAGPHDGSLLIERAIDWLIGARPGTAVVQSAGNYHAREVHMAGRLREARTARLPFHVVRRDDSPVTVELWYKASDSFAARATGPGGETAVADRDTHVVIRGRDGTEYGVLFHRGSDPNNGDHLIQLNLRGTAPAGEWGIEITGIDVIDGRWHAWIERNAACPQCQAQFVAGHADPAATTGSICNAQRTIAVGAYDAHDPTHPLAHFSSAGPTRDGRPKPLLVAPGVRILSVRSRRNASDTPAYVRMSGTSMAAPHVTGTIALMYEVLGAVPIETIRHALFAALLPAPGDGARWGYGLLDVARAVDNAHALKEGRTLPSPPLDPPSHEDEAMSDESAVPGTRPPDFQQWTYGRDQSLPTNVDVVLGALTEQQLDAALAPAPPPVVAVASREQEASPAGADDPGAVLAQALDPAFRGMTVVGWPGRRLNGDLLGGDLILRQDLGGANRAAVVTDPRLERRGGGMIVEILGGRDSHQRIAGPDGLLLADVTIVRPRRMFGESDPEPAARPTIRRGSRGPAVTEAQNRLNLVSTRRAAENSGPGLDHCPLVVDGVFGPATAAATNHFQRIAFAGQPNEWDSVIGPKTWTALIAASSEEAPPDIPPDKPPYVPPEMPPEGPPGIVPVSTGGIQITTKDLLEYTDRVAGTIEHHGTNSGNAQRQRWFRAKADSLDTPFGQIAPLVFEGIAGNFFNLLLRLDDGHSPRWFGVSVAADLTDFSAAHLFFHPTPGEAGHADKFYKEFEGLWPAAYRYVFQLGVQLVAAGKQQVLIVPFMPQSAKVAGTDGIVSRAAIEAILAFVKSHVEAARGTTDGTSAVLGKLVISHFSYGVVSADRFISAASSMVALIRERWDFDSWFLDQGQTAARLRRSTTPLVQFCQDDGPPSQPVQQIAQALVYHLPKPRWTNFPPVRRGRINTPSKIHNSMPECLFAHAAAKSAVG